MNELIPVSLKAVDDELQIVWSDGASHRLSWRLLRDACPCASCRDERDRRAAGSTSSPSSSSQSTYGAKPAQPASTLLPVLSLAEARPLRVTSMKPVGNYAYAIEFTDGHSTGIYTFEYLRELGEQADA